MRSSSDGSLRSRCVGRDREPRRRGALGLARRRADGVGYHTGAIPIRNGSPVAWPARIAGARGGAFVGGGFGPKIMMFYPEEVLVPWAAMRLGRRSSGPKTARRIFSPRHRSAARSTMRARVTKEGKILRCEGRIPARHWCLRSLRPHGADQQPVHPPWAYDIPSYESEFTAVFTNKTIVTPVRGAGRQHGVFVIERLLDFAAKELGIDRVEIRRKNLLRPDQFPFNNEILFQTPRPSPTTAATTRPRSTRRSRSSTTSASSGRSSHGSRRRGVTWDRSGVLRRRDGDRPYEGARVTSSRAARAAGDRRGYQGQGTSRCSRRSWPTCWVWT